MFANLKNKLIEEVKASPSKFQQFANAAQAAVSSSSSTTPSSSSDTNTTIGNNENFFSIAEDDTPQNSPFRIQKLPTASASALRGRSSTQSLNGLGGGAIPRTRKLSNSSMASDVSFRLPTYDAPPIYHLQSDLDETSSEFDDSASTARLDVITKDQLYDAYKKSLDRYHKYRCRYTDLAKKYKELERDSARARSVLVETQDKALRRISELREQCTLEQQAKAHLEEALRVEMDDMSCKMQAYQTKLTLLGENPQSVAAALERSQTGEQSKLIDFDEKPSNGTASVNHHQLNDNELVDLRKSLADCEKQLQQMTENYATATKTITELKKQEEENVLLLAQTKQAIHTELEHKENEVKQLQNKLKKSESDLEVANKRESQLADGKEQLTKLQNAKQETDAKLIATEHLLTTLKVDYADKEKEAAALEAQIQTLKLDSEQSLQDLRQHNAQLNDMVQRYQQNELALADVEGQLAQVKLENAALKAQLVEQEQKVLETEKCLEIDREALAALNAERSATEDLRANYEQQLEQLHREIQILNDQNASSESSTIAALKLELQHVSKTLNTELAAAKTNLAAKEKELKTNGNKLNKLKKQQELHQTKLNEHNVMVEQLNKELSQRDESLRQMVQMENEKLELQTRVTSILEEIAAMQLHLREVQDSHSTLEREKRKLETKIEQLVQQQQEYSAQGELTTEQLKQTELKLEEIERENTKLAERNCLLEEQNNHLENQKAERERQYSSETTAEVSELRLQLRTAQDDLIKLQAKMTQVLDEHSRMQNAQELMDHDHRTLQDKCDAYEKEKLLAEDQLKCAQLTVEELQLAKAVLEAELTELQKSVEVSATELAQFESVRVDLQEQLGALKEAQSNDERHKILLEQAQARNVQLQGEIALFSTQLQTFEQYQRDLEQAQQELMELREKCRERNEELEERKQENEVLTQQVAEAQSKYREALDAQQMHVSERDLNIEKLEAQLACNSTAQVEEVATLKARIESLQKETEALKDANQSKNDELQAVSASHVEQLEAIQMRLRTASTDVERLHEANDALQLEMDTLTNKHTMQLTELQQTLAQREQQLEGNAEASHRLVGFEQMQIENEYLNKHTKHLEEELHKAKTGTQLANDESSEHKEKLKSLQCELYVLQEKAEQHADLLAEKEKQNAEAKAEAEQLKSALQEQSLELTRQTEHASFVTEQNDAVQKELLLANQQLQDKQSELLQANEANLSLEDKLKSLSVEKTQQTETIETLRNDLEVARGELAVGTQRLAELEQMPKQETVLATESKQNASHSEAEHLRSINEQLQRELEDLKYKSNDEHSNLQHEIDELQINNKEMANRIMDLERVRASIQAQQLFASMAPKSVQETTQAEEATETIDDKAELESKLKEIMSEVQDVTNRNLFLEQKCENFLILEQSNERLKSQNAKLSRQLDETLVSMQHSESSVPANTEFEYLRNIMFQYLTGNTNNETLVKVISAVLKFSPQQAQVALEKEHQRRSLLNKIL